jgi:NAD+ kinase
VNLGSLGFLTEIPLSDLYSTLEAWCDNRAEIEVRSMMHAEHIRDGKVLQEWDALNDVVIAKGTIARMGDFSVEIDRQLVATFRADGVIVSTPTGSTAYNLASNGPIVMPSVNAAVDVQAAGPRRLGDHVHCQRSEASVRLLRSRPNSLFSVLRSKLKWGER